MCVNQIGCEPGWMCRRGWIWEPVQSCSLRKDGRINPRVDRPGNNSNSTLVLQTVSVPRCPALIPLIDQIGSLHLLDAMTQTPGTDSRRPQQPEATLAKTVPIAAVFEPVKSRPSFLGGARGLPFCQPSRASAFGFERVLCGWR